MSLPQRKLKEEAKRHHTSYTSAYVDESESQNGNVVALGSDASTRHQDVS